MANFIHDENKDEKNTTNRKNHYLCSIARTHKHYKQYINDKL